MPPKKSAAASSSKSTNAPRVDGRKKKRVESSDDEPEIINVKVRKPNPTKLERVEKQSTALATIAKAGGKLPSVVGTGSSNIIGGLAKVFSSASYDFEGDMHVLERMNVSREIIDKAAVAHIEIKSNLVKALISHVEKEDALKAESFLSTKKYADDLMENPKASTQEKQVAISLMNNVSLGIGSNLSTAGGKTGTMVVSAANAPGIAPPRSSSSKWSLDAYFGNDSNSLLPTASSSSEPTFEPVPTPVHEAEQEEVAAQSLSGFATAQQQSSKK